jgi:uncharacterized membrane protein YedE/YeeE
MNHDPNQPPPPAQPPPPPVAPQPMGAAPGGGQGAPGTAVGGFVCSLVGMILAVIGVCFFIGGPLAAIGLVLSFVGRNHANREGRPSGLATAGIVMGIIGVVAGLIWLAIVLGSDDSDVSFDFDSSVVLPLTVAGSMLRERLLPRGGRA